MAEHSPSFSNKRNAKKHESTRTSFPKYPLRITLINLSLLEKKLNNQSVIVFKPPAATFSFKQITYRCC